jgi:transmembrane sensor
VNKVMTPDDSVPWQLLERYLAGELPPDEQDVVRRWVQANPANEALLDAALRARAVAGSPPPEWNVDRLWRGVVQGTAQAGDAIVPVTQRTPSWRWVSAAAAAIVVAVGGAVAWYELPRTDTYLAVAGQRTTVTLRDGTVATLAPATRLRVMLGRSRRDVALDGEAYFAVVHDAGRPFTVRSGNAIATDIGTRFVVRRYPEDTAVQVTVAEGAVALRDVADAAGGTSGALLGAGTRGTVDRRGATTVTRGIDVATALAWREGRLDFDRAPLRAVAAELGRWYDVDIALADTVIGARLVTTSLKDETLPEALTALSASLRLDVVQRGRVVTFMEAHR